MIMIINFGLTNVKVKNMGKIFIVITLQTKIVEQNYKIQINKGDSGVFRFSLVNKFLSQARWLTSKKQA